MDQKQAPTTLPIEWLGHLDDQTGYLNDRTWPVKIASPTIGPTRDALSLLSSFSLSAPGTAAIGFAYRHRRWCATAATYSECPHPQNLKR